MSLRPFGITMNTLDWVIRSVLEYWSWRLPSQEHDFTMSGIQTGIGLEYKTWSFEFTKFSINFIWSYVDETSRTTIALKIFKSQVTFNISALQKPILTAQPISIKPAFHLFQQRSVLRQPSSTNSIITHQHKRVLRKNSTRSSVSEYSSPR